MPMKITRIIVYSAVDILAYRRSAYFSFAYSINLVKEKKNK